MSREDEFLRDRLRGLAAVAEQAATPPPVERIRARGTKRRNHLRAGGGSVVSVVAIAVAAWFAAPLTSVSAPPTTRVSASPSPSHSPTPDRPVGPVLPIGPLLPIGPVLPVVPGVTWGPGTPYTTTSDRPPADLTDLLYYTCPGADAIAVPAGTAFRYTSARGSEVRQWWVDTAAATGPGAQSRTAAADLVHAMEEFANGCLYRLTDARSDLVPSSATWRWGGGNVRGRLLIAHRDSLVVLQISKMTAPEPDVEVVAQLGEELLDRVTTARPVPVTEPDGRKSGR
jgi:hypothetical protein